MARLALLLLVALLACSAGPPPGLRLHDELRVLDEARCQAAAAGLVAEGATVALFHVASGSDPWPRLRDGGLTRGGRLHPHVVAVFVSRDPRYSQIRVGSHFSEALPSATLERLRTGVLNPGLQEHPETAFPATLEALEDELHAGRAWMATARLWALGALAALPVLWLLAARLGRTRLWAALYARTPAGRREEQRRLAAVREAREQERRSARMAWEVAPVRPVDLSPDTEDLAGFRAALREVTDAHAAMAGAAGAAARRLAAAKSALRGSGVKRRRKAPRQERERVQELQARLAALEARRAGLAGLDRATLLPSLAALAAEFADVDKALQEFAAPAPPRLTWTPTPRDPEPTSPQEEPSSGVSFDFDPSPGDSCAGGDW